MWQVLSKAEGKFSKVDYDTEKEARSWINMIGKWEWVSGVQLIHITDPVKPSMAPIRGDSGYRRNIKEGWKPVESSTITRTGFEVKFEAYGEAAIDVFCDAMNGWYTEWTKWRATFSNGSTTIQVTTRRKDTIDRLFEVIVAVGPDSDPEFSEEELARSYFERIVATKK